MDISGYAVITCEIAEFDSLTGLDATAIMPPLKDRSLGPANRTASAESTSATAASQESDPRKGCQYGRQPDLSRAAVHRGSRLTHVCVAKPGRGLRRVSRSVSSGGAHFRERHGLVGPNPAESGIPGAPRRQPGWG